MSYPPPQARPAVLPPILARLAMVLLLTLGLLLPALPARADAQSTTSVGIVQVTTATQPSGSQFAYRVTYTCDNISASVCGGQPTITIPLGAAASFPKSAFSIPTIPELKSWDIVGGNLVLTLNDLQPGASGQIGIALTPPNGTTPNGTTWTWTPQLTFGDGATPSATAPTSVTSTATATTQFTFSKQAAAAAYRVGDLVTYTFTTYCPGTNTGRQNVDHIVITDVLPSQLDYVSASAPATVSGQTVTVNLSGDTLYAGCGGTNANHVTLVARVNSTAASGTVVTNRATAVATPIGTDPAITRSGSTNFTVIDAAPSPGTIAKTGFGPLLYNVGDSGSLVPASGASADGGYRSATYAGDWVALTRLVGAWLSELRASASYKIQVSYPAAGQQFDLVDPMPCTSVVSGTTYSSGTPGSLCQDPAFNPTRVVAWTWTVSEQLPSGQGIPAAFVPQAVLTDGTTVALEKDSFVFSPSDGTNGPVQAVWRVPAGAVGKVAELRFPHTDGMDATITTFVINGYVDAARQAGDIIANTATVSSYLPGAATPYDVTKTRTGSVYVIDQPRLLSWAAGGMFTAATGVGSNVATFGVKSPVPATADLVQTIILPPDMTDTTGGSVRLTPYTTALVPTDASVLAPFTVPTESQTDPATGATILRFRVPVDKLNALLTATGGGVNFDATLPYQLQAPGTYAFKQWGTWGDEPQDSPCLQGNRTTDSADVDRNAATTSGCYYTKNIVWSPNVTSDSVRLTKTVKGSSDAAFKAYPGVGTVPALGGSATYRLAWVNQSVSDMKDVVVYDVLPRVGDTGTIAATAQRPRGSQFTPALTGLGALPAGVSVQYSTATNPCRPEVLASNPGCVDDWTATAPADLSTVTALKLVAAGPFATSAGFSLEVNMTTPAIESTQVAWNTAASRATSAATGVNLPIAETSKVGIARSDLAHLDLDKTTTTTTAKVGDLVTYTVTGFNDGSVTLTNAQLVDELPAGVTVTDTGGGTVSGSTLSWPVGSLAPGAKVSRVFTVRVDSTAPATGTALTNQLRGTADQNPSTQSTNHPCTGDFTRACASVTMAPSARFTIDKAVDVTAPLPGDTLTWTVTVKNTGDAGGPINATDLLPAGLSFASATGSPTSSVVNGQTRLAWPTLNLAPGATQSWTIKATVPTSAWGKTFENLFSASMPSGTPARAVAERCTPAALSSAQAAGTTVTSPIAACASATALAADPRVVLTKVASGPKNGTGFVAGEVVDFTFTATNRGNVPLENPTITEDAFTDGNAGAVTLDANPAIGAFDGTLSPGESVTWTARHTVTQAEADTHALHNTATVHTDYPSSTGLVGAGPTATDTVDVVLGTPKIALTKVADRTVDLHPQDKVTYTFTATNTGDTALNGVTLAEDSFTNGAGSVALDAAPTAQAGFDGTLAPGATATWTATYTVTQADVDARGPLSNRAHVDATDAGGTAVSATAGEVVNPVAAVSSLSLTKVADKTTDLKPGDKVTYTFTTTNTGTTTLTKVALVEDAFTNGTGAVKLDAAPEAQGGFAGTLAPGATGTWTATYTVTQADVDAAGPISNAAHVDGTDPAGTAVRADASAVVNPVGAAPALQLTKVADKTEGLQAGDKVTYTFTARNIGSTTLDKLTLTETQFVDAKGNKLTLDGEPVVDKAPDGGRLAPGEEIVWKGTWTVTTAAAKNGGLTTNTAQVTAVSPSGQSLTEEASAAVALVAPQEPKPTPSVTPKPTPSVTPKPTPSPSATPRPTPSTTPTPSTVPTPAPSVQPSSSPTAPPAPAGSPDPGPGLADTGAPSGLLPLGIAGLAIAAAGAALVLRRRRP